MKHAQALAYGFASSIDSERDSRDSRQAEKSRESPNEEERKIGSRFNGWDDMMRRLGMWPESHNAATFAFCKAIGHQSNTML